MKINVKIHFDQLFDFNDSGTVKAFGRALPAAALAAGVAFWQLSSWGPVVAVLAAALVFVVAEALVAAVVLAAAEGGARAMMSVVAPSGSSTPAPDDYSYEKSLLARGRVDEALNELRVRLIHHPDDPALCLFAADVHAREARDPAAAERLYLRVREISTATKTQDYAATNRLIDLYLGPLDDPARATRELERMRTRHAGTTAAAGAEKVLAQLRGTTSSLQRRVG
ncbi:MAG TPA: hypothetical protein VFJ82_21445 [Longimicrobium sp.]|nr:hypothetical protein [Longimicrobium sp.]